MARQHLLPGFLFYIMKKIYLILISILSLPVFSQDKPVQRIDDNVAAPHSSTKQALDDNKVYNTAGLDVLPEFPGGVMAFRKIFESGIDKSALKGPNAKSYRVYISFIIEKDGSMTDEKVLRDSGFGLAKQVLGLLEKTKDKWSPGKIGGKAVRVLYHYPITITVP